MTKEELAAMLDGRQYRKETTSEIEQLVRDNNLLIVYGASDDLCEFRGAIDDEFGCYEGGTITHEELLKPIEAIWDLKDRNCSWCYWTELPYVEFKIYEDDELYCIGIVVEINESEKSEILVDTINKQIGKLYDAEQITDEQYDYLMDSNDVVHADHIAVFSNPHSKFKNVHLICGKYYVTVCYDANDPWGISRYVGNRETHEIHSANRDYDFRKIWDNLTAELD